jgi:hypothetical protein
VYGVLLIIFSDCKKLLYEVVDLTYQSSFMEQSYRVANNEVLDWHDGLRYKIVAIASLSGGIATDELE